MERRKWMTVCAAILSFALVMAGCAATTLTSVWKDENYAGGKLKKVLVMAVAKQETNRRLFEDKFVQELKSRGTDAVASYTILPGTQKLERDAVLSRTKSLGADGVLVTRLVDKKSVATYVPGTYYYVPQPYYYNWYDYYGTSYGYAYSPGYTVENEIVVLETNLYETKGEKLIWSAMSETFLEGSPASTVDSIINVLVRDLVAKGLV